MKGFEGVVFYIFASLPKFLGARTVFQDVVLASPMA
jgi:hypothetical protein